MSVPCDHIGNILFPSGLSSGWAVSPTGRLAGPPPRTEGTLKSRHTYCIHRGLSRSPDSSSVMPSLMLEVSDLASSSVPCCEVS